jgi:hypothetical protein
MTGFYLIVPISISQCKYAPVRGLGRGHSAPRGVTLPEDVATQGANHACSEQMWARRQKRQVEGDAELACSQVTDVELASSQVASQNILHPLWVSLKERTRKLACVPLTPFELPHFFSSLIL